MQVLKSVADVSSGEALYSRYSAVTEEEGGWLSLRETVLARKMPRRMLVQSLTTPTQGQPSHSSSCSMPSVLESLVLSVGNNNATADVTITTYLPRVVAHSEVE